MVTMGVGSETGNGDKEIQISNYKIIQSQGWRCIIENIANNSVISLVTDGSYGYLCSFSIFFFAGGRGCYWVCGESYTR